MPRMPVPQANELELSLFGPGIGECVIIHLGNGDWMVVDSCGGSDRQHPVALEYFEGMGVDVGRQVKLIVVTHWHDDHIRGMAQLVRYAESARFACSAALRCEEFFRLVSAGSEVSLIEHSSGISEFSEVLEILNRRTGSKYPKGPDHWAMEGNRLYIDIERKVEAWALSPSSQTITDSKWAISSMIPMPGEPIRRFFQTGPNDLSVAILLLFPGFNMLLGADLEKGYDEKRGWKSVINSGVNPKQKSQVYKVAHHGSMGASLDDIWTKLLVNQAYAILTPYARGRKPLPSSEDVIRMKRFTSSLYCTAWPATKSPPRRDSTVERTINEMVRTHRAIRKRPGHIRIRFPISGVFPSDIKVDCFDGASIL